MMFAIDGPKVSTTDPLGVLAANHLPVSRPPGTPPDPARKVADSVWRTDDQLGTSRLSVTTAITPARAAMARRGARSRAGRGRSTRPRAASTATGAAIGSRYWKPFTGHTWKNATGTAIQHNS